MPLSCNIEFVEAENYGVKLKGKGRIGGGNLQTKIRARISNDVVIRKSGMTSDL